MHAKIHSREPGVSGNFRGRIKGAKYHFPLQDGTWDFPGDAVAGKGKITYVKLSLKRVYDMMVHVYEATRIHIVRAMLEGPGPSDAIWGIFMSSSSSSRRDTT